MFDRNQKAIIVSGFAESDRVQKAMELGVSDFLKKPFTSQQLAFTLTQAFNNNKELVSQ